MKRIIMLGTGSAMVTRCFNTCFLIETKCGDYFLTDAGGGNGILRQIEDAKVPWAKIRHMFVTHGHTDHILGVIWVVRKIASLINQGKYDGEFHIYMHDVVKEMLETMTRLTLKKKDFEVIGRKILFHEVKDGEKVNFSGMTLTAFDIFSTKAKQFGCLLETPELRLCCLGDEPYNEKTEVYAQNADWLLSEAFCLYDDRDIFKPYEKNHSTAKEAGETAMKLAAKNLIIYHTEDKTLATRKEKYAKEAAKYFSGNIFVPEDLESINL